MPITTAMVATVRVAEGLTLAAWWDGGREVRVHVAGAGGAAHVATWHVWNEDWDCPLIEPDRQSFERFVRLRLDEPGVVDGLLAVEG